MIRALLFIFILMAANISLCFAQPDPSLGQASSFVVLAKTQIINNGETGLMGNVGVSPAGTVTGRAQIVLTGGVYEINTAASASALADANASYNFFLSQPATPLLLPITGGASIMPGYHKINGNTTLSGTLTLDGLDQSTSLFVIILDGNLSSEPVNTNIRLINGAQAKNVFWVISGGVDLGTNTLFQGSLLAKGDINLNTGANGAGRAISLEGKVELDGNNLFLPTFVNPNLSITKTVSDKTGDFYRVGDKIIYTIVVDNAGPGTATNIIVTENFPASLRYVPNSAKYADGVFNESTFTWTMGLLQFGERRQIELTFEIVSAGTIVNKVSVDAEETDPREDDNEDEVIIVVPQISSNLNVTKVAAGAPYYVGGNVTYTITVTNAGPYDAKEFSVTEQLPAGLEFVSAVPSLGSYNSGTGIYTVGGLAVGAQATLTLVAKIKAPGKILNTVTVSVPDNSDVPDLTPGDNTGGEEILVTCAPVTAFEITGALEGHLCEGATNAVFTATPIPGATYSFTFTGGLTQVSQTGNSITVSAGATSGRVEVTARDLCGNTFTASKEVKVLSRLANPTAITGPAKVCQNSTNEFSVADYGADATYQWATTGDLQITTGLNTPTVQVSAGLLGGSLTLVVRNDCFSTTLISKVIATTTLPNKPAAITGNATVCIGSQVTYSTAAVDRADSYVWTVPAGWTVVTGQDTRTITLQVGNTAGGESLSVAAVNACGTTAAATIPVQVNDIPAAPAAITGSLLVCAGKEVTYEIAAVPGATGYNWTPPAGWSFVRGGGLTVTYRTGQAGGDLTVTATNGCGSSAATKIAVTVNDKPATPGAITGPSAVCARGTGNTYSIAAVAGATEYVWAVPEDWVIAQGQGSTTITVTAGAAAGTVKVKAKNECGDSAERTFNSTINPVPAAPAAILNGGTVVCAGTEVSYNVAAVAGATGYTWTLPAGWSFVSGEGTASATVRVGQAGGNISITADNSCGGSIARTLAVTVIDKLAAPAISGSLGACIGERLTYTIPAVTGATGYAWTVPATWTVVSGQSSRSIVAEVGAGEGQVTVAVLNACGAGSAATLNVAPVLAPIETNTIVGNASVCEYGETATYTLATVEEGVAYTWTIPANWTMVAGQGTGTITVNTTATAGAISVSAKNSCGTARTITKDVSVTVPPVSPATIIDKSTVCGGLTYTIDAVQGATGYTWTVPAGFTITSGQGTTTITVKADPNAVGEVTVAALNGNCSSVAASARIDVSLADGQLDFPKAFSPNGDGKNDTWWITNLEKYPANEVTIFNRWGSEVYKTRNYQNNWSASKLEKGTYFYKVRVTVCDGVVKEFTGYTTLFR